MGMILNLRVAEDQSVEIPDIGFHSLNERVGGYSRSLGQQKKSILYINVGDIGWTGINAHIKYCAEGPHKCAEPKNSRPPDIPDNSYFCGSHSQRMEM